MSQGTIYGREHPISYGININYNGMMHAIPHKKRYDYSPTFIEWFVDFHAKRLNILDWERFPQWMLPLLKRRAEEIHDGLHFNC